MRERKVKNSLCKMQLAVEVIQLTIWVCLCGTLLNQTSEGGFVALSPLVLSCRVLLFCNPLPHNYQPLNYNDHSEI